MRGLRIPYDSRKTCLMLAISVLVCHVLQANGCMSKALQMYSEYLAGKKPCTDTRRVKIRVGRNPVRYVTVDDYGAHEGKFHSYFKLIFKLILEFRKNLTLAIVN